MIEDRRQQIMKLKRNFRRRLKAEILKTGQDMGLFDSRNSKAFIFENLNKRRGRFDQCSKDELAMVFTNAGVDLDRIKCEGGH